MSEDTSTKKRTLDNGHEYEHKRKIMKIDSEVISLLEYKFYWDIYVNINLKGCTKRRSTIETKTAINEY